ncbi:NUDIX hydrolase [Paenibacillus ginsengarvi]|uniref:NUDIX domain-containing protein n=1 Tax=Paenibacillus ginsengarvi TaxID=400777 RepID=A0A3B0CL76_9BACL|nr:NUDIX hydrolase [Paenibacillus ginsengarvi]RKN86133.1 NUDIX domain-containing protein [Paenibacillus ginsengarvi]
MGYIQTIRKKVGHDRIVAVGAGVFVYQDRKVLLQKRKDNLCWALHGGIVEMGEEVEDAAKRELYEETGLVANKLELLGVFSGETRMYTYPNGDEVYLIGIVYVCNDFSGELIPETDETLELKWFDIDDLPQQISPPNIKPLESFVQFMKARSM